MYCKTCGSEYVSNDAAICVKCGVKKGVGTSYCHNCGEQTQPGASVCLNCGVAVAPSTYKSKMAAGLLGIFLGYFGVHNFYLEYTKKAVIQLIVGVVGGVLTCGIATAAVSIWGLIEGIMILTDRITVDGKGNPLMP